MTRVLPNLLVLARVCLVTGRYEAAECTAPHTACTSLVQQKQWLSSRSAYIVTNSEDEKNSSLVPAATKPVQLHNTRPQETAVTQSDADSGYLAVFPSIRWDKRGRPEIQMKSLVMMMLMPSGICLIMYCTFLMIRYMEDSASEAHDVQETRPNHGKLESKIPGVLYYAPLTEELVSPARSECSVVLPSLSEIKPSAARCECDIVSKIGTPIVRVVVTCMANADPESAAGGSRGLTGQVVERLELISAKRQNLLGTCELQVAEQSGASDGRQLKARIFQHTGDLFALLQEIAMPGDDSQPADGAAPAVGMYREFLLTSATGAAWKRRICGNVMRRRMSVTDEEGNQIINVERGGSFHSESSDQSVPLAANSYKLRIQPKVDAGVVIAALLAIDRFPRSRQI
mmetsp:Transcript_45053/g.84213  ORF Transcript_45053/g.84213 Transcript_45053/m.84213 type:complete len:401 (+) Transcript_45053:98-1300(+)